MESGSTGRFACTVEAWYDFAKNVYHLALLVYPETARCIMEDGRSPSCVEGRLLDLIFGRGLPKICVRLRVHKGIVPLHGILECHRWHRNFLLSVLSQLASQFRHCV